MTATITGIGLVAPTGRGARDFFTALRTGRSGLVRPVGSVLSAAGVAPEIDATAYVPPAGARSVDRFVLLALAAAEDALHDARLAIGADVDPERVAVVVGTGAGGMGVFEQQAVGRHERGRSAVSPYLQPGFLPNMAAARIAIRHGIRGYSSAIATACASGALAVAEALRLIRAGDADVVLCGAAEAPLSPTAIAGFTNARALATGWPDPAQACRPFDKRRNGFVLGEGAGVLVVERTADADARGAAGYADVSGWGATTDAHHPTMPHPDGDGAARCMRIAVTDAGLALSDVDYVNAHGTGTVVGDVAEARAITTAFGAHVPAVSSTKAVTGHLLGAAGAVEAAATALAIAENTLPPTRNLDDPDPECALEHVTTARSLPVTAAVSNSFAFGGHNVSLVFTRPGTRRARGVSDPGRPRVDDLHGQVEEADVDQ